MTSTVFPGGVSARIFRIAPLSATGLPSKLVMTSPPINPALTKGVFGPAMPCTRAPPPSAVSKPSTPRKDLGALVTMTPPGDLNVKGRAPLLISTIITIIQIIQFPRTGLHAKRQGRGEVYAPDCWPSEVVLFGWSGACPHVGRAANGPVAAEVAAMRGAFGSSRCVATYSSTPSPRR